MEKLALLISQLPSPRTLGGQSGFPTSVLPYFYIIPNYRHLTTFPPHHRLPEDVGLVVLTILNVFNIHLDFMGLNSRGH